MSSKKILWFIKRGLEHRYLPAVLALIASIIMIPALKSGLLMDDFVQRIVLVESSQLPDRLHETGHVPDSPGRLSTAVFNLFGFNRGSHNMNQYKNYGLLPWWTYEKAKASLWRPFTALTHWLDYQLFPNSPALMHAHNILWFAAVVFLVTLLYRRLMAVTWLAGLAAVLFLLDKNSYFPVVFIANRGFIVSIFFAVLTILAHHRWRRTGSPAAAIGAQSLLLLSLLSNEAGVTTFAYLFAYALTLERPNWRRRALSLAPAVFVIIFWRVIYNLLGYGVCGVEMYIDPGREPLSYISALLERIPIILMGQLGGQSPEAFHFVSDSVQRQFWLFSLSFLAFLFVMFVPLLRKNRLARFWFAAMIFSVFPIATVAPMSKNLPFVAVAAFGVIASFVGGLLAKESWIPKSRLWQLSARVICIIFLIVHIPAAVTGRIIALKMTDFIFNAMNHAIDIGSSPELQNQDVVIVNVPCQLALTSMPFFRAYNGQPLPRTARALAPGSNDLEILRTDEKTIILKTRSDNFFSCDQKSPLHFAYLFRMFNIFRAERFPFRVGDKVALSILTAEVLNVDEQGQPTEVSFSFDVPLDDPSLRWLWFDWKTGRYFPFEVPQIGEKIEIPSPVPVSFSKSMKFLKNAVLKR